MPGTETLVRRMAVSWSSSDTSVEMRRLMRPSARTTGVKFRLTPIGR
jgi:hypothetical protein